MVFSGWLIFWGGKKLLQGILICSGSPFLERKIPSSRKNGPLCYYFSIFVTFILLSYPKEEGNILNTRRKVGFLEGGVQ